MELQAACQHQHCDVHAYVLMTNHLYLLITSHQESGIGNVMQRVGRSMESAAIGFLSG